MNNPNTPDPGVQPEPAPAPVKPDPAAPPAAPEPAKKKMKLWKKILLVTGGSLLGLILLILLIGPTIIGAVAKSKIPSVLGPMLDSEVTVGNVSFSWSGHVELVDL